MTPHDRVSPQGDESNWSAATTRYLLVNQFGGLSVLMTEAEAFAYVRRFHDGRACGCRFCEKSSPECEVAGIRKA
jgi:hypothetical protein